MKRIWNWIRRIFKKDEIYTIIVTKDGVDELWVYKNGKCAWERDNKSYILLNTFWMIVGLVGIWNSL